MQLNFSLDEAELWVFPHLTCGLTTRCSSYKQRLCTRVGIMPDWALHDWTNAAR